MIKRLKIKVQSFTWQKGFTLVELLMTVTIVSILGAIVLATLNPISQIQKGRDTKRKSDLAQVQRALETYYQDNGRYPPQAANCPYQIQGSNGDADDCISWGQRWSPFMSRLPREDSPTRLYRYYVTSNGQAFYLFASLERGGKDPQACNANGTACSVAATNNITCGNNSEICNYGLSSSNTTP